MPNKINLVGLIITACTYPLGLFPEQIIDLQRARARELATFDKRRRAVGMPNPMRDKNEGTSPGGEGTAPVTTACPEGR